MRRAEGGETGRFLRCFREARADAEQPRMTRAGIGGTAGAQGTHAEKWHRSLSRISPYAGSQNPVRKATSPTRANGKDAHREARATSRHVARGRIRRYKSQTKANSTTTAKTARLNDKPAATKTNSKANIPSPGLGIDCSFVTQGHHWVDAYGAPRWNIERRECGGK